MFIKGAIVFGVHNHRMDCDRDCPPPRTADRSGVFKTRPSPEQVGEVVGTKNPGLARWSSPQGSSGSAVSADSHSGLVLDVAVRDNGEWALMPDESLPGLGTRAALRGAETSDSNLIGVVEPENEYW